MNTLTLKTVRKTAAPYMTVFTPVFNGEKHISRVFKSIVDQTFKNFEWIIIDDGSCDNTRYLVENFISLHPEIDIRFFSQSNCGKHIAWNRAVEMARGRLFIPADADDYFLPDTLNFFMNRWESLPKSERKGISGINVLCYDNDTQNFVGKPYPKDGMKSNNLELQYKYQINGEKWGCIRTDLLKSRKFPIIKNTHYPESYLWLHFAKRFKLICFNTALRRYYTTDTGILQNLKKKTVNGAWVSIKYNNWFLRNFGFYLMVYSPKTIYWTVRGTLSCMLVITKSWFSQKSIRLTAAEPAR